MATKAPEPVSEPANGTTDSQPVVAPASDLPAEDESGGSDNEASQTTTKAKKKPRKKKKKPTAQTSPPSVLLSKLFQTYPEGEAVDYTTQRTTDEERRSWDKANAQFLSDYRQGAEAHRQVRQWAQKNIKPGQTLTEIANGIEDSVRRILGHDGMTEGDALIAGMGFPTGLNLDNVAAHYSPNAGCKKVLEQSSVMKVDIGVHVGGRIVDSAFTIAFDPMYDNLLTAVKEATNTGLREAGIDVRLGELGGLIQETMESYECEINGTTYPIKPIQNLSGHTILPYSIHGTKSVPLIKTDDMTKMEEGDVFAIETFGSTGKGYTVQQGECSHYAIDQDAPQTNLPPGSAKSILGTIKRNFGTLPFCRRYLDRIGQEKYLYGLNTLVKAGIVEDYPPLVDRPGSYTAQFEHTILLKPYSKEIISRGDDY